jgi:Subtilase family
MDLPDDQLPARFRQQKAEIDKVIPVSVGTQPDDPTRPSFLYEKGVVLIHEDDVDDLGPQVNAERIDQPNSTGYARFATDDVPGAVTRFNSVRRGISPNHIVHIARVNVCPADEPVPVPGKPLVVPTADPGAGRDVHIRLLDTGLVELADPKAMGAPLPGSISGEPDPPYDEYGRIKFYAGHGSFIARTIANLAPAATVTATSELTLAAFVGEVQLGMALHAVLASDPPDIICLSAGTESAYGRPLNGLTSFVQRLRDQDPPKTLLVAAAGNNGSVRPFYPAGSADPYPTGSPPSVLAVGALREDTYGRACFSNHGDWVTVYAPGERLLNVFFAGGYYYYRHDSSSCCRYDDLYPNCTCVEPRYRFGNVVTFEGVTQWSGTSFATPIVAGLVAARMTSGDRLSAPEAALSLLRESIEEIKDAADHRPIRRILPPGYPLPTKNRR